MAVANPASYAITHIIHVCVTHLFNQMGCEYGAAMACSVNKYHRLLFINCTGELRQKIGEHTATGINKGQPLAIFNGTRLLPLIKTFYLVKI